jgi:hypothetical protein
MPCHSQSRSHHSGRTTTVPETKPRQSLWSSAVVPPPPWVRVGSASQDLLGDGRHAGGRPLPADDMATPSSRTFTVDAPDAIAKPLAHLLRFRDSVEHNTKVTKGSAIDTSR